MKTNNSIKLKLRSIQNLVLTGSILLLVACGGGGGGPEPTPEPDPDTPNGAPSKVELSAPLQKATCTVLNPTFQWKTATDPDNDNLSYTLCLGSSSGAKDVLEKTGLNSLSYTVQSSLLEPNKEYYWYVIVNDGKDHSVQSDTWSFSTLSGAVENHIPSSPVLSAPLNGTEMGARVHLAWEASDGDGENLTYTVYLEQNNPPQVEESTTTDQKMEVELTDGTWYWQVRAEDTSGNSSLSGISSFRVNTSLVDDGLPAYVEPLIDNEWQAHAWPYNALCPEKTDAYDGDDIYNGHYTNSCGPTALARLLYGLRYPIDNLTGNFDYMLWGLHFVCDVNSMELDYDKMPRKLNGDSSEEEYIEIAKLMQITNALGNVCGSTYGYEDPEKHGCGTIGGINFTNEGPLITNLRLYLNTTDDLQVLNRWDYSREDWIKIMKTELAEGRTIMVAGRTVDSPSPDEEGGVTGHWFNVEGYNENDQFFVGFNLGEQQKYYDVDDFGQFKAYNQMVIGFIPR